MLSTVMDDTAEHPQTLAPSAVTVRYLCMPSVPITHHTGSVGPDEQVTVAQPSTCLEIMGATPGGDPSTLGCLPE